MDTGSKISALDEAFYNTNGVEDPSTEEFDMCMLHLKET